MNTRQVQDLYTEILTIWPNPAPKMDEQSQWGIVLTDEEQMIAERTLTYLEQEMVQGNPRKFRPALTEWEYRYKLLDKARQSSTSVPPHECSGGMVQVSAPDKDSTGGHWRPCGHCNPAGYERWRNGEYWTRVSKAEPEVSDRSIGFGWLDKIRAERGLSPKVREVVPAAPIDTEELF